MKPGKYPSKAPTAKIRGGRRRGFVGPANSAGGELSPQEVLGLKLALLKPLRPGRSGILIIAHKDRQRHTCDIVVLNQEHWSPEEELVQDLLAVTQVFSARLYSLRI